MVPVTFALSQRLFQTYPERLTEQQAKIGVSQQFPQPVIHQAAYKLLELLGCEL